MNDATLETCDPDLDMDLSDEAPDRAESQLQIHTIGGTHACHIDQAG